MRKIEYELSEKEEAKFRAWYKEQNQKAAKLQVERGELSDRPELEKEVLRQQCPYAGCVSAGPTWILDECGIGTAIKARHWYTKEEIDLTDYDRW